MRSSPPALLALALLAACAAQPPAANTRPSRPPAVPGRLSDADRRLLWEEAVATHDGLAYTYALHVFPSDEAARRCDPSVLRCPEASSHRAEGVRLNEVPLALRERVGSLAEGEASDPIPLPRGRFAVIVLERKATARFGGAGERDAWLDAHAAEALPSPQALRTDPALVRRRARNQVRSKYDLVAAMDRGDITRAELDGLLSNGSTMLVQALGKLDLALVRALLDRGASPDACGLLRCPLQEAALNGEESIRILLEHRADPDGPGGERETPLMVASRRANRAVAQLLLDAGADPLRSRLERIGRLTLLRSTLFYAPSRSRAYVEWLAGVIDQALARSGTYRWAGWIVQDGRRIPIAEGSRVVLRRAPFQVRLRMSAQGGLRVVASADARLLEKGKDVLFRRELLGPGRVGAADARSTFLALSPLAWDAKGELQPDVVTNEWGYADDPGRSTGTRRVQAGAAPEYERTVDQLIANGKAVPIAAYQGGPISILMGALPPLGAGADLFQPVRLTVTFR